jgi:hypothetical protein
LPSLPTINVSILIKVGTRILTLDLKKMEKNEDYLKKNENENNLKKKNGKKWRRPQQKIENEDDLKKNGKKWRRPKKMENEDNLKKNGKWRLPQKNKKINNNRLWHNSKLT